MPKEDGSMVSRQLKVILMGSGSDMHILLTGEVGYSKFDKPFILGHECAGIVAKGKSPSIILG